MSWLIKVNYNVRYDRGEFEGVEEFRLIEKADTFVGAIGIFTRWKQKQNPEIVHINNIEDMTITED